jgi:glycosyltransferase involved in cell wall biosynthesis
VRVAYTLEHCWHHVPGGTAVAANEVAEVLVRRTDVQLIGVAGTHSAAPKVPLPTGIEVRHLRPRSSRSLYASWLWAGRPTIESITGPVDVTHAVGFVPPPTKAPLVVTFHDLAFIREPAHFGRWGRMVLGRSLAVTRRRASLVLCSSSATVEDCAAQGIGRDRLRLVPLGVRPIAVDAAAIVDVRHRYGLPEEYLLFVGTLEPRKNLHRLIEAVRRVPDAPPLVVVGPAGWGDAVPSLDGVDVRLLGRVPGADRDALYAGSAVTCYPSIWEGFGLPVLEAMAAGAPVVTSRGISTEEVAGGAAVLVDPLDIDDIARGIVEARSDRVRLVEAGHRRVAECTWERTAELTIAAYRDVVNDGGVTR